MNKTNRDRAGKILTVIILLPTICLTTALLACAEMNDGNEPTENTPVQFSTDESDNNADISQDTITPAELPDEDFDGRVFNVITPVFDAGTVYHMFVAEEENGELINDALYKRTVIIEDRYNIKINQITNDGPAARAQRSIKSGDDDYNLILERGWAGFPLANQGLLVNMYEIPYISEAVSESKPWWDAALTRDMTINGKLFFHAGDIMMHDKLLVYITLFNKKLFSENNIEYPYKYVLDGTWTFDKMFSITRGLNRDINGDGIFDQSDQWGLVAEYSASGRLHQSAGEKTIDIGDDGYPYFAMDNPRSIDVINKLMPYMLDGESMLMAEDIRNPSTGDGYSESGVYFQEDRIFMWMTTLEHVIRGNLRAMPTDFGIIPTPKFNDAQENYYTFLEMSTSMASVPVTTDVYFTGLITEALAYESVSTLTPAFYDLTLMVKNTRDDESEAMLDIIFQNRIYDIGTFNTSLLVFDIFWAAVNDKRADLVSVMEAKKDMINAAIDKFNQDY